MKRAMFIMLIAIAAALSSCNKTNQNNTATQTTSTANLPLQATQYIDNNYPDASILYVVAVTNSAAAFIVTLNTTEELAFTSAGNYLGDGANYHGGHHGGDTIHHDSIHHDSIHCDTIRGGHHGGDPGGGSHENGIPIGSLSHLIKDYIKANFAAYTIRHAEIDSVCPEGAVTVVVIGMAGQEPLKLYFDESNTFLYKDTWVLYADIPQAVKNYITANYTGYSTCNRSAKLAMADYSIQYVIHLRLNNIHITVRLQEDGTLICVR